MVAINPHRGSDWYEYFLESLLEDEELVRAYVTEILEHPDEHNDSEKALATVISHYYLDK